MRQAVSPDNFVRDSIVKRLLLKGYFSALELRKGLRGIVGQPGYKVVAADYDQYWRHRSLMGIEPRFAIITEQIESGASCLDIGCGDGALLHHIVEKKRGTVLGLDISLVAVEKAQARGVTARVQRLEDFVAENPAAQFDHVFISEVLEHVPNPEYFVAQGWRLARKTLWVTFPNIAYFPHRLRLLAGKFPVQWVVFPGEHLRFWSLVDFRHWLVAQGMPAGTVHPSNGFILFGLHRRWPNLLANQTVVALPKPSGPPPAKFV